MAAAGAVGVRVAISADGARHFVSFEDDLFTCAASSHKQHAAHNLQRVAWEQSAAKRAIGMDGAALAAQHAILYGCNHLTRQSPPAARHVSQYDHAEWDASKPAL